MAKPMQDICELTCPECRTVAHIQKGGVGELKTNLHLWNLAEAHRDHSLKQQMKQHTLLTKEATKRLSELSLQQDPHGYVEMQASDEAYVEPMQTSKSPPIEHTYIDTSPRVRVPKPVDRPLPDIPKDDPPPQVRSSPKPTHHRNPPVDDVPPKTIEEKNPPNQAATNFMDKNPIRASSFGKFEQVQAIACTPDGLMAACDFSDMAVKIFERKQGTYKQIFQLELFAENPRKPADVAILNVASTEKMVSLSRNSPPATKAGYKFLVARHLGIEVYTSNGKYEKIIQPCRTDGICCVTTTADDRILMGDIKKFVITKHDSELSYRLSP